MGDGYKKPEGTGGTDGVDLGGVRLPDSLVDEGGLGLIREVGDK